MNNNLLYKYYLDTEKKYLDLNEKVAESIISQYKSNGRCCKYGDSYFDSFLYTYFYLKKRNKHKELEDILNKYNINYRISIQVAIYDLLLDKEKRAVLWPGMISEEHNESLYMLKTKIGTINVYKASEVFKNSKSSYIFNRRLVKCCYERTFDFLKQNKDYKAVLSYDDNMFVGGHFHAYLEKDDETLDIASNALYKSREEKDKVLRGEVIKKLTYDEVIDSFNKVLKEVPNLNTDNDKLEVLTLYYAKKKSIK